MTGITASEFIMLFVTCGILSGGVGFVVGLFVGLMCDGKFTDDKGPQ